MGTRNPQVDRYIANAAEFARPILTHIREVVHEACPEVIEEMKWSVPHFTYNGMLCAMTSFKAHCGFGFWKGKLVVPNISDEGAGQFGKLTSIKDLPSKKVLAGYIKTAMKLNDDGVQAPHVAAQRAKAKKSASKPVVLPPELAAALKQHKKAAVAFEAMSPSHRREYADWISSAKQDETRQRRLAKAMEQIAKGKSQNWKYEKKC